MLTSKDKLEVKSWKDVSPHVTETIAQMVFIVKVCVIWSAELHFMNPCDPKCGWTIIYSKNKVFASVLVLRNSFS